MVGVATLPPVQLAADLATIEVLAAHSARAAVPEIGIDRP